MMNLIETLIMMDELYDSMCRCSSSTGKGFSGRRMDNLMEEYPVLNEYWERTNARRWVDRFVKIKDVTNLTPDTEIPDFDDGIDYDAPNAKGLYFIGETHFNPITHEEFYWVKIGKAVNLRNRMRQYNTHCPMLWRIDFSGDYAYENVYHIWLRQHCIAACNHNEEWFMVDRDTYLAMCEKGFAYFA